MIIVFNSIGGRLHISALNQDSEQLYFYKDYTQCYNKTYSILSNFIPIEANGCYYGKLYFGTIYSTFYNQFRQLNHPALYLQLYILGAHAFNVDGEVHITNILYNQQSDDNYIRNLLFSVMYSRCIFEIGNKNDFARLKMFFGLFCIF